jgi:hypothetical protein
MSTPYQITSEDIRSRRARLLELEEEAADIQRWLDSVRSIFGDQLFEEAGAAEHASPIKKPSPRTSAESNMTTAVFLTALAAAPRGLTSGELRREISADPVIEKRLKTSLKYFYNLVGRLKKRGLAKSVGKRLVAVQQSLDGNGPPSGGRR